jgi:hypothetical protein
MPGVTGSSPVSSTIEFKIGVEIASTIRLRADCVSVARARASSGLIPRWEHSVPSAPRRTRGGWPIEASSEACGASSGGVSYLADPRRADSRVRHRHEPLARGRGLPLEPTSGRAGEAPHRDRRRAPRRTCTATTKSREGLEGAPEGPNGGTGELRHRVLLVPRSRYPTAAIFDDKLERPQHGGGRSRNKSLGPLSRAERAQRRAVRIGKPQAPHSERSKRSRRVS